MSQIANSKKQFKFFTKTSANGKKIKAYDVVQGTGDDGQPLRIQAESGTHYELFDPRTERGPERVRAKRADRDLEIFFEGSTRPDIIVEQYYNEAIVEFPKDSLTGILPKGDLAIYVIDEGLRPALTTLAGEITPIVLLENFLVPWWWHVAAGAVGLALLDDGSAAAAAVPDLVIQGTVTAGPVKAGMTIEVYDKNGNKLGETTVDANGYWKIEKAGMGDYRGAILVKAIDSNGTAINYTDEVTGTDKSLDTPALRAMGLAQTSNAQFVIEPAKSTLTIHITPLTEVAVRAAGVSTNLPPADAQVTAANTAAASAMGLTGVDITATQPLATNSAGFDSTLTTVFNPVTGKLSSSAAYGLALAKLSGVDANTGSLETSLTQLSAALNVQTQQFNATGAALVDQGRQTALDQLKTGNTTFNAGSGDSNINTALNRQLLGDAAIQQQSLDGTGHLVVQGTALPGSTVTVTLPDGSTQSTTADANGNFSLTSTGTYTSAAVSLPLRAQDGLTQPALHVEPPVADVAATSDTGISNTDNITSDTTPTISGMGVAGHTITVTFPTGEVLTTVVDANGNWSVTPTQSLTSGTHNIAVTATDQAGNVSDPTQVPVTIDASAPTIAWSLTSPASDNVTGGTLGTLASGNTSNDATPTLSFSAEAGSTVKVYDGTTLLGTATEGPAGTFTFTPSTALADGAHSFTATATDAAGNTSAPTTAFALTIDTSAPTISLTTVADDVPGITGNLSTGATTNDNQPALTFSAEAGSTVKVYDGTTLLGTATEGPAGTFTFTPSAALSEGAHSFTATATDAVGNTSAPTTAFDLTVDTLAPPAPAADVAEVSDLGVSNSDNLTSDNTPTISGTGTAGDTITVTFPTGEVLTAVVASNGTWSVTPTLALPDGVQSVSVTATDPAGNVSAPTDVPVTIDTTPPAAPTVDTQTSNTLTPVLSGTAVLTAGETLTVSVGGATYAVTPNAQGVWHLDPSTSTPLSGTVPTFTNGRTYDVTATVMDPAGNTSTDVSAGELTIDTSAPAVTLPEASNGVNATEKANLLGTPLSITLPASAVAGDTITTVATKPDGTTVTLTTVLTASDIAAGNIEQVIPTAQLNVDGVWSTSTSLTHGGTTGAASPGSFVLDTTAPAAPVADLAAASDSGTSQTDHITSDNTPTIEGTGTPGDTITVTMPGTGEVLTAVVAANGSWSVTPTQALADGVQNVSVTATDPAGNTSPATLVPVTIDTTPPAAPVADVAAASDTGASNTDNITSDNTPTITGTGTPGDTITVTFPTGEVLTAVVAGNGSWSVTPTQALSDGVQSVSVTATDPAGNTSAPTTVPLTIDTTPPAAPAADVAAASDTGASNTDNITADTTPTITGTGVPGDTITVTFPTGEVLTAVVASNGSWSVTPTQALADGVQSVSVTATDPAGNTSAPTDVPLTIDTTANVPTVLASVANTLTPVIRGGAHLTPGETLAVTVGGATYAVTPNAQGTWTLDLATASPTSGTLALNYGTASVTAVVTDAAGNIGTDTTTGELLIDVGLVAVSLPEAPNGVNATEAASAGGTPLLCGLPAGAMPGDVIDTVVTRPDGSTFTLSTTLSAADVAAGQLYQTIPTSELSTANNGSWTTSTTLSHNGVATNASPGSFVLDTVAPAAPAADVATASDTGASPTDNLTADDTPTITGSGATPGDTITVTFPTGEVLTAVVDSNGNWSVTPTQALPDGAQNVSVTATDPAGNVSAPTTVALTIDTTAPAAPAVAIPEAASGVSATEAADGVQLSVTLPADARVGDTVTTVVTAPDGTQLTLTHTVLAAELPPAQGGTATGSGPFTIGQTVPLSALQPAGANTPYLDGAWTTSSTLTDAAGNTSPAMADGFRLAANAPTIAIATVAGDNVINAAEASGDVPVSGTTTAEPGQTVTVTLVDSANTVVGTYTTTVQPDGSYSLNIPSTALGTDGSYTLKADVSNAAGTPAVQGTHAVTVDTTAPAISITSVAGDAIDATHLSGLFDAIERGPLSGNAVTTRPVISGTTTAEAGQTVNITLDGHTYTTTVQNGGVWSYTLTNAEALSLSHGNTYAIVASVSDLAGNSGSDTDNSLVVNIAPPDIPTVVEQYTAHHTPTITGAAKKDAGNSSYVNLANGDVLSVTVNGVSYSLTIGQTSSPAGLTYANGTWSLVPASIPNGHYEVAVSVTAGGVTKTDISRAELHINDVPPAIAIDPISGGTLNAAESTQALPITGTTDAPVGATVTLTLGGQTYTAQVQAGGTFSVTVPGTAVTNIADGLQTASASVTNAYGQTGTANQGLLVDTTAPGAATVAVPEGPYVNAAEALSAGGTPLDITLPAGSQAGDVVTTTVTLPDGTVQVLSTTLTPADITAGSITQTIATADLNVDGAWTTSTTITDTAGNTGPAATGGFTLDTSAPAAPSASLAAASDSGLVGDSVTHDTTPTLTGAGVPGDTITVKDAAGNVIATATVAANGTWSATPTTPLADGLHPLSVTATDPAGNVSAPTALPLTIDTTANVPTVTASVGNTLTPTIGGTALLAAGESLTVTVGGATYAVTPNAQGVWTLDLATATPISGTLSLVNGTHSVTAVVTDAAGNVGTDTSSSGLVIDTGRVAVSLPEAPNGVNAAEAASNGGTPIVSTLPVGAVAGDVITTVVTRPDGTTFTLSTTLTAADLFNGSISQLIPTSELSAAHNGSWTTGTTLSHNGVAGSTTPGSFVLDTVAPAAPAADVAAASDTGVPGDHITADNTPTIAGGGATPGNTITVTLPTGEVLTAVVAADGSWSVTPTQALPDGAQNISVTATDPAGNTSIPTTVTLTIDTTPPAAPVGDVAAASDSGTSQTDNITADTTPTITGTGTDGDTITVTLPTGEMLTAVVANGTWSVTPTQPLTDGTHNVSVTATDPAGNTSAPALVPVTVDTTAPAAPAAVLDPTSDSGTLGDGVTNDTTPTISGTGATPGDTITLYAPDGTTVLGTAVVAPNGSWAITPTTPLADGLQALSVTATDPAGNESAATPVPVNIDTTPPSAPAADVAAASDTGSSNTDNITNDTTPTISGTGTPGNTITVTMPTGEVLTTVVAPNGSWSVTPLQALTDGAHNVTVTATDPAGNTSAPTTVALTVDTVAPATPAAPDMTAATDLGASASDNITNDSTPDFTVTAPPTGGSVVLLVDGVAVPATYDAATGTVTPNSPLTDGAHAISYQVVDAAGNASAASPALSVTIDTQAPATPAAPNMTDATDSGASNTDNSTNHTTPDFAVAAPPAGGSVVLLVDGVAVPATYDAATGTVTPNSPLADGPHAISYQLVDLAGNTSAASPALNVTIDTQAPATPAAPDMTAATDSGNTTDNTTRDATPDFTVTAPPAGGSVVLLVDGVAVPATYDATTGTLTPNTALADGPHAISYQLVDLAGNTSAASPALSVTIDTLAPAVPTVTALTSNSLTPVISGGAALATGDVLTVTVNGATYTVDPANPATGISFANGVWSINTATATPSSGTLAAFVSGQNYSVAATATDAAGNSSTDTSSNELRVDTSAPSVTVPEGPLVNASEASSNGGTPIVTALPATAQVGDVVTTTVTPPGGSPITLTTTLQAADITAGSISQLIPTADLTTDGAWTTSTRINSGTAVAGGFTLDATPPAISLSAVADNVAGGTVGNLASGDVTNDATPTLTFAAEAGSTVQVYDTINGVSTLLGTATEGPAGTFTFTPGTALTDGAHSFTATATDAAGNTSAPTGAFAITVDTVAPATPVAPDMTAATDLGTSDTDNTTKDSTPDFTVTAPPAGGSVVLLVDGVAVPATYANGTLTPNSPLADGPHSISYQLVDAAGNTSTASPTLSVTIDTAAPTQPSLTAPEGPRVNALEAADGTPLVTTLPAGAQAGDVLTITVTPPSSGTPITLSYTLLPADIAAGTVSQALTSAQLSTGGDGSWTISATLTDVAGNTSPAASGSFTLDTTPPAASGALTATAPNDSGTLGDNTTRNVTPSINGTTEPGASVSVVINGRTYTTTADATTGVWSITTNTLPDGSCTPAITVTDLAGNTTTANGTAFTVDTSAPAISLSSVSDNVPGITGNLSSGATSNDTTPTLTFAAEAGSTVKVYDTINGVSTLLGTATEGPAGTFTFTPGTALGTGAHSFTATATDAAGNTSAFALSIDTTPPAISLTTVADDVPGITGNLSTGATSNDNKPTLTFTAEAGSTVQVFDGATLLGTATEGPAGVFTFTPGTALADGAHSFTAKATDAAGNTSGATTAFALTIDATPPATPTVTAQTSNTLTPVIAGTATLAAGETMTVTVAGATYTINPASLGTGISYNSGTGAWSVNTATATPTSGSLATLVSGSSYPVTATVTDAAGNSTSDSSTNELSYAAPTLNAALASASDSGVQGDSITNDTTPTISGVSTPGSTVRLYNGATLLGSAVVAYDGSWSITPTAALSAGLVNLTATSTTTGGTVTGPVTVPVTIDTASAITVTSVAGDAVGASGNGTFSLLERGYNTSTYTLNASVTTPPVIAGATDAEAGRTVTLTLNGKTYTTTVVSGGGIAGQANSWSYTLSDADAKLLNHGNSYAITTSVNDAAGNTCTDNNNGVTISIAPPDVPTVINQFNLQTLTPTITGTAQKLDNSNNTINLATGDTLTVVLKNATGTALGTYTLTVGASSVTTGSGANSELSFDKTTGAWTLGLPLTGTGAGVPALPGAGFYNVDVTTSVADGQGGTVTRSDISSQEISLQPTAPTINATLWAATGAGNTSSLTGVGEANYAVSYNTTANAFVSSGTADGVLWNSEFIGMGTVVRVQLPTTGGVPPVAGNTVRLSWGGVDIDVTLTSAMITAKYVDVTVPEATIRSVGYGDVNVTAQIIGGGISSALATQSVKVAFDLPLALPADPTSASYGYVINGAGPGGTVVAVNNNRDASGSNVSFMGDLNADGYDDVAVGDAYNKKIYVVWGHSGNAATNLSSVNGSSNGFTVSMTTANGGVTDSYFDVSSTDYNGDGYNDLIFSASPDSADLRNAMAYVVYGNSTGNTTFGNGYVAGNRGFANTQGNHVTSYATLASKIVYDTASPSGFWQPYGGGVPTNIGMTGVGDVNGDGYEDYIVGQMAGAHVIFGKSDGVGPFALAGGVPSTVTYGFVIRAHDALGYFGAVNVGGGGDINGDGLDDLVIGGETYNGVTAAVNVVFGKASNDTVFQSDLAAASNNMGFRITDAGQRVSSTGAALGALDSKASVQVLGDVNGDGLADIAVAQYDRAVVVFGKTDGTTVSASAIAAGTSSSGFAIQGNAATMGGFGFVVNAGDMNGDGLADMVVQTGGSRAYLVFGQTAGANVIQLSSPDITKFVPITNEGGSNAQSSISAAGDVNGDGFDDLIIGVSLADTTGTNNFGRSYIVYGGMSDVTGGVFQASRGDAIGTSGADTLTGTASSNQLVGGDGNDRIIGNGGADVMYGGRGDDTFVLNANNADMLARNSGNDSQNIARINGGNGIDTIELDSASLDLSQVRNAAIDGIERFNLNGNGSSLKLSALDVIDLSKDNNAFNTLNGWTATASGGATGWGAVNKYAQAVVDGDATNVLTLLQPGWTNIGNVQHTENGTTTVYKVMQSNSAAAQVLVATSAQLRMPPSVLAAANELANGLTYTEASSGSGTPVRISLTDTGAVAGNTLQLNWGGQTVTYTVTSQDLSNGYADVLVSTSALTTVTAVGTSGNVDAYVTLLNGATTVSQSDTASVAVNFVQPTAPTISATLWAASGAGNSSSLTGVGEANYAADSTSFVSTGTADGILWNSEILGNGTVVRVQLPTTGTLPPVAGDTLRLNWGGTNVDVTVTTAMITAKYVDITVPEATIRAAGYGDVAVTAQIIQASTGNGSALASQTVTYAFDLPLALPANPTSPSYGFVVNGGGTKSTIISTNNARDAFGSDVTNMGDMNGDGLDDYMVADTLNGKMTVVFGQTGLGKVEASAVTAGAGGFVIDTLVGTTSSTGGVNHYTQLASADINGDGLNDVAIVVNNFSSNDANCDVFVVYGKTSTSTVTLYSNFAASQGFKITSAAGTKDLGSMMLFDGTTHLDLGSGGNPNNIGITNAGDVNGDGFDDFIIGDNYAHPTVANAANSIGRAFVLFGGSANSAAVDLSNMTSTTSSPNMTNGYFIDGNGTLGKYAASAVGGGGDVNGDGLDDVLLSVNASGSATASVFVSYGKTSATEQSITALTGSSTLGFQITNAGQTSSSSGAALNVTNKMASAQIVGDINGDGLADITIAQYDRAVVVFGKNTAGAVDAAAIAAGTSTAGFVIQGDSAKTGSFGFLVNAGDMNGDGLADMALYTTSNHAYLIFGQTASATTINLAAPDLNKFVAIANEWGSTAQSMVNAAGDINGDGFDDLLIGVPTSDSAVGTDTGRSYVVYGGFSEVTNAVFQVSNGDVIGTSGNDTINGTSSANQLVGGAGNDVITGNGGADVMYGGAGNDTFVLNADNVAMLARNSGNTSQGIARINGGNDIDTIKLDGASLDLSQVQNAAIDGIERFNLNGNGSSLKMGAVDVIQLSQDNNSFNTANGWTVTSSGGATGWGATNRYAQAVVDGDATNILTLQSSWTNIGNVQHTEGGTTTVYKVLQSNSTAAQVLVANSVQLRMPPSVLASANELASGLTYTEATSGGGTPVRVSLADTGAAVGNTLQLNWGGQTVTYTVTSQDLSNGYADISVLTNQLTAATALGSSGNVAVSVTLQSGSTTVSQSDAVSVAVNFVVPDAPAVTSAAWTSTVASDTSGIPEMKYEVLFTPPTTGTTVTSTGTADGVIRTTEAYSSNGTTVRLAFNKTAGVATAAVAGDVLTLTVGNVTPITYTLTSTDITNGAALITVPFATLQQFPVGTNIAVSATVTSATTGNASAPVSVNIQTAYEVPLAWIGQGSTDATPPGFVFSGQSANDTFGSSVASAGDVNGDGLEDFIVGAYQASPQGANSGKAYVIYGRTDAGPLNLSAIAAGSGGFVINGNSASAYVGRSVSGIGDVNGDGLADVFVGAPGNSLGTNGAAYVIYGSSNTSSPINLSNLAASQGFKISGDATASYVGNTVSAAGDFNGDGFDDFVTSGTIILGSASTGNINLATATNVFKIAGISSSGMSPTSFGDFNGDGLDDVVMGMPTSGKTYVVFGKTDSNAISLDASKNFTNASMGLVINGAAATAGDGHRTTMLGDINGDGLADVGIESASGAYQYVVFGTTSTTPFALSSLSSGTPAGGFAITGFSGNFNAIAAAGDLNGDGLMDVFVMNSGDRVYGAAYGAGYVVFGRTGTSMVNVDTMAASEGFRITGWSGALTLGAMSDRGTISTSGDVNGDGFDDLVIGAQNSTVNGNQYAGQTYVVYGGASEYTSLVFDSANGDAIGTSGNDTLGDATANRNNQFNGGLGNDTITGNGGADVMYGGAGNDTFVLNTDNVAMLARNTGNTSQNIARVDGGTGMDTLKLDGAGITLDLTAIRNDVISQVENLDISGSGSNTLKLTANDVLDMGDNNLFNVNPSAIDTRKQLMVTADADDKVVLTDLTDWTLATGANNTFTSNGHTYDVYNHNTKALQLLIDHAILQSNITMV